MIAAACAEIVKELKGNRLHPYDGKSQSNIKPLTIVIQKQLKFLKYLDGKIQYVVRSCCISDIVTGDAITVKEEKEELSYNNVNESTCSISGEMAFSIWNYIPSWVYSAAATDGMSLKIKTDKLILKTVTESAFNNALKGRSIDETNDLIKTYLNLRDHSICVVTEILETTKETEVECTINQKKNAEVSVKMKEQSGSASVSNNTSNNKKSTLSAGHVIGFRWTPINIIIDGDNGYRISLSPNEFSNLKLMKAGSNFLPEQSNEEEIEKEDGDDEEEEEEEESDDDENSNDLRLSDIRRDTDGNIEYLKDAVSTIMHSPTDIEELEYLFARRNGEKEKFVGQLVKKDKVLQFLELIGIEYVGNLIKITSRGPFKNLIPVLLEALSFLSSEELELIGKYDANQRAELLRIIKEAINDKTTIPIDPEFTEDLKKGSFKNALAVMNFTINFEKREVSTPMEPTCQFDAFWIILNCL